MMNIRQKGKLLQGLDPKTVKKRKGPGGKMLSYISGEQAIDTANDIFGFDGWQMETLELRCLDPEGKKANYLARVKVTALGCSREGVGYGDASGKSSSLSLHELASKEAETDAMKRALRTFGSRFGLSLYDKENPVHNGGEDSMSKKLQEGDSGILLQTLSTVLAASQTAKDLQEAMRTKGFREDAKALAPQHYETLVAQAKKRKEELS